MLAGTTALGCGMTVCVALWTSGSTAAEAPESQVAQFGDWTVTITPGPIAVRPLMIPPSPVRFASYQEEPPVTALQPTVSVVDPVSPAVSSAISNPVICPGDVVARARAYQDVYNAIPFSRVEYNANASYRHDLAVEILFGQMRPTVIQKGHTSVDVNHHNDYPMYGPFYGFSGRGYYYPNVYNGVRVYRGF